MLRKGREEKEGDKRGRKRRQTETDTLNTAKTLFPKLLFF